jgi:hypothetical protein
MYVYEFLDLAGMHGDFFLNGRRGTWAYQSSLSKGNNELFICVVYSPIHPSMTNQALSALQAWLIFSTIRHDMT